MCAALFLGFATLGLLARYLVLGFQWLLLALPFPPVLTGAIALGLAALTAWGAWSLLRRLAPFSRQA